jgi:hypothetical protein
LTQISAGVGWIFKIFRTLPMNLLRTWRVGMRGPELGKADFLGLWYILMGVFRNQILGKERNRRGEPGS